MSSSPLLAKTDAAGRPLMRCPSCQATSDSFPFQVDAAKGIMECHAVRDPAIPGHHSLPYKDKTEKFLISRV